MPISYKKTDWTTDARGRSNASTQFDDICNEVERLIRGDAFSLIAGKADSTARLIVAQLAHIHGMRPTKRVPKSQKGNRHDGQGSDAG